VRVSFWRSGGWVWEKGHWHDGLHWERGRWRRKPDTSPAWQHALAFAMFVLLGIVVLLYWYGAAHGEALPPLSG
jgi:hypothetical protein